MLYQSDSKELLKTLPDNSVDAIVTDLDIGKVGEHLVCADLILKGYKAHLSDQGLPYDVIADVNGKLLKIQVKTTRGVRPIPQRFKYTPAYLFHIKRCGKGGKKKYQSYDFDVMALVALDKNIIGYISNGAVKGTMHINEEKLAALTFEKIWK